MILKYEHLLGRQFVHGKQDCYTMVRDFFRDNWDIPITDYARPDGWWNQGMNLYMSNLDAEGFKVVHLGREEPQLGDVHLLAIQSSVPNHAAIYIGNSMILHHFYGRLSNRETFRGPWQRALMATVRHKDAVITAEPTVQYDLMKDPRIAWRFKNAVPA